MTEDSEEMTEARSARAEEHVSSEPSVIRHPSSVIPLYALVSLERVPNLLFTYAIPEGMAVAVGHKVIVPWQRIYHVGYVVARRAARRPLWRSARPARYPPHQ